jgi:hypothetical protein
MRDRPMTDDDEGGGAPMTLDDLRRAEAAAADLDDLGVMASAWECGTAALRGTGKGLMPG